MNFNTKNCIDINECDQQYVCPPLTKCINTNGSFSCECTSGFYWSSVKQKCLDINECIMHSDNNDFNAVGQLNNSVYSTNVCEENSICVNTIGSYSCECKIGWIKTDLNYCLGNKLLEKKRRILNK